MAAIYSFEPKANSGKSKEVLMHRRIAVLLGLGNKVPAEILEDKETFIFRVDPRATPLGLGAREGVYPAEWGDVLRLPVAGSYSHDPAEIEATASKETLWVGNKKLFPTVYDLMRVAPHCREDTAFALAEKGEDGEYVLSYHKSKYHPMSGKLPSPGSFTPEEGLAILSITLGVIQATLAMRDADIPNAGQPHPDSRRPRQIRVYANDYSTFSVHTAPKVMLISYYGLAATGMGKTQDKFDRNPTYRSLVYEYANALTNSYMQATGTKSAWECAKALTRLLCPGLEPAA